MYFMKELHPPARAMKDRGYRGTGSANCRAGLNPIAVPSPPVGRMRARPDAGSSASRPVSRVLWCRKATRRSFICDACRHAPEATYPETRTDHTSPLARRVSLFGLAPDGVYPATGVGRRGALLPHLFTLTPPPTPGPLCGDGVGGGAVCFLWHFP